MTTPAPGIYLGVSYDAYAAWPAARHSDLKEFSRSPAHARYRQLHGGGDQTEAQGFGTLCHLLLFQPERLELEYALTPEARVDRRTKDGKAAYAAWVAEAKGRIPLDRDEHRRAARIVDAIRSVPTVAELLRAPGANEVSIAWQDERSGELCKARLDAVRSFMGWTFVLDLKTALDASPRAFSRAIAAFGYHSQAAFYLDGLAALAEAGRRFVFVAAEKDEPHGVALYEIDDEDLEVGRRTYRRHLAQYAECRRTGVWPSYPDGVEPLRLPGWARKEQEEVVSG
jgi:exodeoxyribonuclease VIII